MDNERTRWLLKLYSTHTAMVAKRLILLRSINRGTGTTPAVFQTIPTFFGNVVLKKLSKNMAE